MTKSNQMQFLKDLPNKKITVVREFDASPEDIWRTWTESEYLDQWWAPLPWKAETKTLNFKTGGYWLYAMVGPDNSRHWSKVDFNNIVPNKSFEANSFFCDEQGNKNTELPAMSWKNEFQPTEKGMKVVVNISFTSEADMKQIVQMGFEEGFASALNNLEQYVAAHFKLRKELKTSNKARTATYLNFPGNTEEAMNFYKSIFGTEFTGDGIHRFGDIPAEPGNPQVSEQVKKMVLHVELPILGGHLLMATDAPKEMGFSLNQGNNMHICLEPETREETKRLFDDLSAAGNITMPLKDMFFGAYYGALTDKYGINWMLNHNNEAEK